MRLLSLALDGFRNFGSARLELGSRVTVLWGRNGQGKTNLLEATEFLFEQRSFRARSLTDLLQWGRPDAKLSGQVEVAGLKRTVEVKIEAGRRQLSVDGKGVRRDSSALSGVGVVLFVPEDLQLPRASPGSRRTFVDRAAFGIDRVFYSEAAAYARVLKSRNAVLKSDGVRPHLLETYDEQLAVSGARMVSRRRALTLSLAPLTNDIFSSIHADLGIGLHYRSDPRIEEAQGEVELRAVLLAALEGSRKEDLRRGHTRVGPHTDDLEISMAGRLAASHASQGQLRSLVLALKLAELENLTRSLGEPPLLLLDDVASELDEIRRRKLFEALAQLPGQALLTLTDPDLLPHLPGRSDREIHQGAFRDVGLAQGSTRAG